jgi:hypothetical protein
MTDLLKCVKVPSNDMVFANVVYVSPDDYKKFINDPNFKGTVKLKNNTVMILAESVDIYVGEVGLNGPQRTYMGIEISDSITIAPCNDIPTMALISLNVHCGFKTKETLKEKDVRDYFLKTFNGTVFNGTTVSGEKQKIPMMMGDKVLVLEVIKMEIWSTSEASITDRTSVGMLSDDTVVELTPLKHPCMRWESFVVRNGYFRAYSMPLIASKVFVTVASEVLDATIHESDIQTQFINLYKYDVVTTGHQLSLFDGKVIFDVIAVIAEVGGKFLNSGAVTKDTKIEVYAPKYVEFK